MRYVLAGHRRFSIRVFGVAVMAVVAGACGSQDCASVGYQSGVQLQVPTRLWSIAEFCIDDQCLPSDASLDGAGFIDVKDEPARYTFRLRVVNPDGQEVVREGTVETKPYRGNGSGCDPLTANAVVRVGEDGDVTIGSP